MPKFMLCLHDNPATWASVSPEEMQKAILKYRAWGDKLKELGIYHAGHKLMDDNGKVLRGKNHARVTDGPYSETRELLGGFFLIEAPDYNAAVDLARECPHLEFGGAIEVRMVDDPAMRKA